MSRFQAVGRERLGPPRPHCSSTVRFTQHRPTETLARDARSQNRRVRRGVAAKERTSAERRTSRVSFGAATRRPTAFGQFVPQGVPLRMSVERDDKQRALDPRSPRREGSERGESWRTHGLLRPGCLVGPSLSTLPDARHWPVARQAFSAAARCPTGRPSQVGPARVPSARARRGPCSRRAREALGLEKLQKLARQQGRGWLERRHPSSSSGALAERSTLCTVMQCSTRSHNSLRASAPERKGE